MLDGHELRDLSGSVSDICTRPHSHQHPILTLNLLKHKFLAHLFISSITQLKFQNVLVRASYQSFAIGLVVSVTQSHIRRR